MSEPKETLNPVTAFYSYEKLLEIADEKIITETPTKAFDFLIKAKELNPNPDYRYYNILGRAHWKLGQKQDAVEAYKQSIQLNSEQTDLMLYVADYYDGIRKPVLALEFTELYLTKNPNAKYRLYTAGLLSRRIGNESKYESYMNLLESDKSFESEKDALQTTLSKHLKNRKWKEAEELTLRYIPYFPREETMYETLLLARRGGSFPTLEEAYIWVCTIFKKETRYFVRYGVFLQEEGRYLESLASFRRAYFNVLKYEPESDPFEILFLIRQSYANLGRDRDTLAIDQLVKDKKNSKKLNANLVENHLNTYRKNREYLLFAVHWFLVNDPNRVGEFRKRLDERDTEFEELELLNVIGPFSLEPMLL
ncbi:tetratricopeptide repeat protein [Leptospira sp. 96542]|nr:tetratricopeptide repeat protein [Leptospira sp. 96542]